MIIMIYILVYINVAEKRECFELSGVRKRPINTSFGEAKVLFYVSRNFLTIAILN